RRIFTTPNCSRTVTTERTPIVPNSPTPKPWFQRTGCSRTVPQGESALFPAQHFAHCGGCLAKAAEWKVISGGPTVKLMEEVGRELTIDPETAIAKQTMKDVLVVIQDTGSARR